MYEYNDKSLGVGLTLYLCSRIIVGASPLELLASLVVSFRPHSDSDTQKLKKKKKNN